jgi:hypothetical protein
MMLGIVAIAISSVGLLVAGWCHEYHADDGYRTNSRDRKSARPLVPGNATSSGKFLFEAMTLTSFGGILGVVLAVGASFILILLFPSLPARIPLWAVLAGFGVSTGIGLIFGVWPAKKAANLDPIESLRYE